MNNDGILNNRYIILTKIKPKKKFNLVRLDMNGVIIIILNTILYKCVMILFSV